MSEAAIFTLATVGLGVVFGVLELLARRTSMSPEYTRRIAHVMACVYAVVIHRVLPLWGFVAVALGFVALMATSKAIRALRSIHDTRRVTLGEVYLPLGLAMAAIVAGADQRAFVTAAVVLGFADVAAGLTGELRGSTVKTAAGTLAFAVVALGVILVGGYGPLLSIVTTVTLAAVERVSSRGLDNVTVPVVATLMLVALQG